MPETVAHEKGLVKAGGRDRAIRSAYEEFAGTVHRIIGGAQTAAELLISE